MKIKRVFTNNHKKSIILEIKGQVLEYPFSQLTLKPTSNNPIVSIYVDPELAHEGFTYVLESGKEDSIHIDDVLYYNKDPEYLCELMLHTMTSKALEALKSKKISKRELARRLKTSPRQLYRLLDPAFYGKSVDQMVKLLYVLGHRIELRIEKEAA